MAALDEFKEILTKDAPLAPLTGLGIGGKAEFLATPRSSEELSKLVKSARAAGLPCRILGGGTNILVPDEGVQGMVVRLSHDAFKKIEVHGTTVRAGAGAHLADLIAEACKASASGLEILVGIPGTVGGAVQKNSGDRAGDIGQHVQSVEVMDLEGNISTRTRPDVRFGYRESNLDDSIILSATFSLDADQSENLVRRVKRLWIAKKAAQPFEFEAAGYVFSNSRGLSAVELIEKAGLPGTKVGGAELSDRNPVFIVAHPGCTSRDVLRLIDLVRSRVQSQLNVDLELQIDVW